MVEQFHGYGPRSHCSDLRTRGIESGTRSEEHTSELQSHSDFVCRLLLEKEKIRLRENLVDTVVRPGADQSCVFAVAKPVGDLFDGGLFEVVGEGGLAGGGRGAGQNVGGGVSQSLDASAGAHGARGLMSIFESLLRAPWKGA